MNVEHRILNKVFCRFINRRSEAISLFDVQRSMLDAQKKCNRSRFEIGNWKLGRDETSLRIIRRKVLSESNATGYKAIVDKLGPKLNAFINSNKKHEDQI